MKTYLNSFKFPSPDAEYNKLRRETNGPWWGCYNNFYPFGVLPDNMRHLRFSPITIFYGANGSGKTTILNIVAETLRIERSVKINKSCFLKDFLSLCDYELSETPAAAKIITSDDVFSELFKLRDKNEEIDIKRDESIEIAQKSNTPGVYIKDLMKERVGNGKWFDDIDYLISICKARGKTRSAYAKKTAGHNILGKSNGETAMDFFINNLNEPGLYLLDEPENSLSATYQRKLSDFLFDSARHFGAQLIISTHSPFMLSMPMATIYNLDDENAPVTDDWTMLENMKEYYNLFKKYSKRFEV